MVEIRDGQDMVEKPLTSRSRVFHGLALPGVLWPSHAVAPGLERGISLHALSALFNHNVAPFLGIMALESGKKLLDRHPCLPITQDRLTATLCLSGRLTARLWVKLPPGRVADSKERRQGTAKICLKKWPRYG